MSNRALEAARRTRHTAELAAKDETIKKLRAELRQSRKDRKQALQEMDDAYEMLRELRGT
jgi:hypothetical protein